MKVVIIYLKHFWLSLLLLCLIGINLFFGQKIHKHIASVKRMEAELQEQIRKDETFLRKLKELKRQVNFYKKTLLKDWIYSFHSDTAAEAFLLDYFAQQVKRYKGKLQMCQIQPSPLAFSPSLQLKTIKLQASFTKYINILQFLQFLEKTPPLFIVEKVAINRAGTKLDVIIECKFAYNLKHAS